MTYCSIVIIYSGTSLIRTSTIRLLGLSGVKRELLQILINAQNTCIKKKKWPTSCPSKKRRRVVLTLEKKLIILEHLKKGTTQEELASEYGVGRTTIGDIKKSEEKLKSFSLTMESLAMNSKGRKIMRLADDKVGTV